MKCGGIAPAKEIATLAQHAGIDLMWGCNDESIISISAALHAALASPNTRYLDLDGSLDLSASVSTGNPAAQVRTPLPKHAISGTFLWSEIPTRPAIKPKLRDTHRRTSSSAF